MQLIDLKGSYDAIYSLGDLCLPAIQMELNEIRPFAGPLDWMQSQNLSDVTRLLRNRFARFMDYSHLEVISKASEKLYYVKETEYNVYSNHDFYTHNNFPPELNAYPEVKAKYDRRVARFLEKAALSDHILFIRTEATMEQTKELTDVLSAMVAGSYRLLIVNHAPVSGIVEQHWPLPHVCAIQLPDEEIWHGNDLLWKEIFQGIALHEE
ncbi:DUF1796 family putative cysteine peptidase [Paenibacillus sp. CF384]|uniref:DUF1796 family putative cysteine peptidase n=1 Tax=Paenibacillus sp. CF384 TaxID=1884382 RepID=UPI00089C7290|nr:DUF1796 family putative cysteine peptidase [Paenibacillus sp. CF384]SDX96998.1 Putative papain-like cysteine peptidase [Paenibacillus sp. CF384]